MLATNRPLGVKLIGIWIFVNIVMLMYMALSHPGELNSFVEMVLWVPSIVGLWRMKKWGASLTLVTLAITLGISLNNLLLIYHSFLPVLTFVPINSFRVFLNSAAVVYLFTGIFAEKFE